MSQLGILYAPALSKSKLVRKYGVGNASYVLPKDKYVSKLYPEIKDLPQMFFDLLNNIVARQSMQLFSNLNVKDIFESTVETSLNCFGGLRIL